MEGDSLRVLTERFATLLYYSLASQMPRPSGVHKYSKGGMLRGFQMKKAPRGFEIIMSNGVSYSHYAMGFNDSGAKRTPRGDLERINFATIDKVINHLANIMTGGNTSNDNN